MTAAGLDPFYLETMASLFSRRPTRASRNVRYRQGTIVEWNNITLENVIDVDGTNLTNLPVLGISETAQYSPGDVVGILLIGEEGAQTWVIIGQLAIPGSTAAADALSLLGSLIKSDTVAALETTSTTTPHDLTTPGPTIEDVRIGPSGKALVFITAQSYISTTTNGTIRRGYAGYTVSGATTIAYQTALGFARTQESLSVVLGESGWSTAIKLQENLNTGLHTFHMQYQMSAPTDGGGFANRNITVLPL